MEPSPLTCSILLIYGIKFESITYYITAYMLTVHLKYYIFIRQVHIKTLQVIS
jgi:hypothetical protein